MKRRAPVLRLAFVCCVVAPFLSRAQEAAARPCLRRQGALRGTKGAQRLELERRIRLLEERNTQEVYVVKDQVTDSTETFLKQTEINGYVSSLVFLQFQSAGQQ